MLILPIYIAISLVSEGKLGLLVIVEVTSLNKEKYPTKPISK